MTEEEFDKRKREIFDESDKKINDLCKKYALANNPYKKGDILQDHFQIIIVESIEYYCSSFTPYPSCGYVGIRLTKKMKPFKNKKKGFMYQFNVKKLIKKGDN